MFHYLVALSLCSPQAALAVPVGTLTVESRSVQLVRKGEHSRPCRRREPLRVGDTLTVGAGGRAIVSLVANQELWRLSENSSVEVTPHALRLLGGTKPALAGKLQSVRADPGRTLPIHLASIVRGGEDTLSPSGTVRKGRVPLQWSPEPWAASATVEILSPKGATLWTHTLPDPQKPPVMLPDFLEKEGVWYQVRLTQRGVRGPEGTIPRTAQEVPLRLLPTPQRQELEKIEALLRTSLSAEPFTLGLALGDLYADYGLTSEFAAALALAFGDKKESGEALWQLGQWYERAQQKNQALATYRRVWDSGLHDPELKKSLETLRKKGK